MSRPWEYEMARKFTKNKAKKRVQTKNSFYFYMQEYNVTYLEGKVTDLRRLQELASPSWQQMGDDERKPYDVMANKARNHVDTSRRSNPVEELRMQETHKKEMMKMAMDDIDFIVTRLDAATTMQTCEFYFFHANSYVRTATGIVVPCEVALCRYSIRNGVMEVFDKIINIRAIPAGYAYEAKATAEATHHIPEKVDFAETDVMKLYRDMLQFLIPKVKISPDLSLVNLQLSLPPVYVTKTVAELAKECLGAIVVECLDCLPSDKDTGEPRLPLFNVYPIEELVHKITKKIQNSVEMGNPEVLKEEQEIKLLNKNPSCIYSKFFNDQYGQAPSTACKFHESVDCREFCSRSFVIRMAYIMSDCCCHILGVRRHTWHHYPENYVVKNRHTEVVFLNSTPTPPQTPANNNQEQHHFDKEEHPFNEEHFLNPFGDRNSSAGTDELRVEPKPWNLPPAVEHPIYSNAPVTSRDTKQVHLLPPTCSVLTDEEDADEDETCSSVSQAPTFSHYRDALDMSKVIKRKEEQAKAIKLEKVDSESSEHQAQTSSKESAKSLFNFENFPERHYLERKRSEDAEEKREGQYSSFQTDTESVVSLPLQRYNSPRPTKPESPVQAVPEVSQGAIPRRRRMPGYDPAKEQNMIAAYTKEKQAVQSVAEPLPPQTPVPEVKVLQPGSDSLPPMSTQGNFYRGRKQSSQDVSAAPSTPSPIKQEKVDETSGSVVAAGDAPAEEVDIKPAFRLVPFEGSYTKEYADKWLNESEPEPAIKEEPVEAMEVVENVYFLRSEYNA